MFNESEDFSLGVDLYEPEKEGEVVSCIEAMPEGTDHEYPELRDSSTFEGGSLVYTFPEPLLDSNVPM